MKSPEQILREREAAERAAQERAREAAEEHAKQRAAEIHKTVAEKVEARWEAGLDTLAVPVDVNGYFYGDVGKAPAIREHLEALLRPHWRLVDIRLCRDSYGTSHTEVEVSPARPLPIPASAPEPDVTERRRWLPIPWFNKPRSA